MPGQRSPTFLHNRLAQNLRQRRQKLGISQEELARRSGVHRTYVGAVERAERNISLAILELLAEGLDCDPNELLAGPTVDEMASPQPGTG